MIPINRRPSQYKGNNHRLLHPNTYPLPMPSCSQLYPLLAQSFSSFSSSRPHLTSTTLVPSPPFPFLFQLPYRQADTVVWLVCRPFNKLAAKAKKTRKYGRGGGRNGPPSHDENNAMKTTFILAVSQKTPITDPDYDWLGILQKTVLEILNIMYTRTAYTAVRGGALVELNRLCVGWEDIPVEAMFRKAVQIIRTCFFR